MAEPLTPEDFETRTWERFAAHLTARIDALREENDQFLDDVKTARIRGRIAELKELLALEAQATEARASRGRAGEPPQPSSPLGNF